MEIDGFLAAISLQGRLVISTFQSIPWHWKRLPRRRSSASSTRSDRPPLKTHLDSAPVDLSPTPFLSGIPDEPPPAIFLHQRFSTSRIRLINQFRMLCVATHPSQCPWGSSILPVEVIHLNSENNRTEQTRMALNQYFQLQEAFTADL